MNKVLTLIGCLLLSFQVYASGSVVINGKEVKSKEDLHLRLSKELKFPIYYGHNLDALYDVLSTDYSGESQIRIRFVEILKNKLGANYTEAFIQTIIDAAVVNSRIILILE